MGGCVGAAWIKHPAVRGVDHAVVTGIVVDSDGEDAVWVLVLVDIVRVIHATLVIDIPLVVVLVVSVSWVETGVLVDDGKDRVGVGVMRVGVGGVVVGVGIGYGYGIGGRSC